MCSSCGVTRTIGPGIVNGGALVEHGDRVMDVRGARMDGVFGEIMRRTIFVVEF